MCMLCIKKKKKSNELILPPTPDGGLSSKNLCGHLYRRGNWGGGICPSLHIYHK